MLTVTIFITTNPSIPKWNCFANLALELVEANCRGCFLSGQTVESISWEMPLGSGSSGDHGRVCVDAVCFPGDTPRVPSTERCSTVARLSRPVSRIRRKTSGAGICPESSEESSAQWDRCLSRLSLRFSVIRHLTLEIKGKLDLHRKCVRWGMRSGLKSYPVTYFSHMDPSNICDFVN